MLTSSLNFTIPHQSSKLLLSSQRSPKLVTVCIDHQLFQKTKPIPLECGSLYHAAGPADFFWVVIAAMMTAVLLAGLILRERSGPIRIGTESAALLAIYAGAVALQIFVT